MVYWMTRLCVARSSVFVVRTCVHVFFCGMIAHPKVSGSLFPALLSYLSACSPTSFSLPSPLPPFQVRLILVVIGGPINILLASVISYKMGYFVFTTVGSNNTLISKQDKAMQMFQTHTGLFFLPPQWLCVMYCTHTCTCVPYVFSQEHTRSVPSSSPCNTSCSK